MGMQLARFQRKGEGKACRAWKEAFYAATSLKASRFGFLHLVIRSCDGLTFTLTRGVCCLSTSGLRLMRLLRLLLVLSSSMSLSAPCPIPKPKTPIPTGTSAHIVLRLGPARGEIDFGSSVPWSRTGVSS